MDGYPPWLGYTLGYDMIGRYLTEHRHRSAYDLAHEPYTEFKSTLTN